MSETRRGRPAWDERLTGWYEEATEEERARYHRRFRDLIGVLGAQNHAYWALAHAGYGSAAELARASDAELLAVPGIGPVLLRHVRARVGSLPEWVVEE